MKLPIYLDFQATTPVDERVFDAMRPYFCEVFGNAASKSHTFGWAAEAAVEKAREEVAQLIGASSREIVFTSGATEANNLAIKGVLHAYASKGNHVVTVATEHKAVIDPLKHSSANVTYLGVDKDGLVDVAELENALTDKTVLLSVMLANNEIGVIQPIQAIGQLCRKRGIVFHCDAVQGAGKIPFNVEDCNVDLASLSAHKMYGPKGVGALYIRRKPRIHLMAQMDGGGHERGFRSGTLNVPGIVGLGAACRVAAQGMTEEAERTLRLRERLREGLWKNIAGVTLNGSLESRLPGNLNVSFEGIEGEALMLSMREVAVSAGSACTSASLEPSHVLTALGLSKEAARGAIRFGIGRTTSAEEIDYVVTKVTQTVEHLRAVHSQGNYTSVKEDSA